MGFCDMKVGDIVLSKYTEHESSYVDEPRYWTIVKLHKGKENYLFTIEKFNDPYYLYPDDQKTSIRKHDLKWGNRIEHLKVLDLLDPDLIRSLERCPIHFEKHKAEFKEFLKQLLLKQVGPYPVIEKPAPVETTNGPLNDDKVRAPKVASASGGIGIRIVYV